ncbi:hypothetical protein [Nocardia abscessus]|uniref:hypothetical protein n=1 Tax=Nocardia abscessus TaxID=120957 RepID=UPI0024546710|nr:hypothetical protein [Nocardia abscessus]
MSWGQTLSRAGWHTAAGALVTVGSGVAVNLATSGDYPGWVWVAVAVSTLAVFGVSLWAQHNQSPPAAAPAADVDMGILDAGENLRMGKVQSAGGFRVQQARSGKDMEFGDIETGHSGDASHP